MTQSCAICTAEHLLTCSYHYAAHGIDDLRLVVPVLVAALVVAAISEPSSKSPRWCAVGSCTIRRFEWSWSLQKRHHVHQLPSLATFVGSPLAASARLGVAPRGPSEVMCVAKTASGPADTGNDLAEWGGTAW